MEKIEKPKRTGKLNHNLTFTECLAEDYYIHGMQFENEEISYLSIERLSLNQCHFKNVVFLECEFDHIDLTDTTILSGLQKNVYPLYDELKELRGLKGVKEHLAYIRDKQDDYSKKNIAKYLKKSIEQYLPIVKRQDIDHE